MDWWRSVAPTLDFGIVGRVILWPNRLIGFTNMDKYNLCVEIPIKSPFYARKSTDVWGTHAEFKLISCLLGQKDYIYILLFCYCDPLESLHILLETRLRW